MEQIVVMPQEQLAALIEEIMKGLLSPAFPPYHSLADDAKKLYTRNEIAVILKVTPNTVSRYRKKKLLHGTNMNGVWRFSEKELNRFINQKAK